MERGTRNSLPTKLLSYCQQIACGMSFLVERGCVVSSLATRHILLSEEDVCKVGHNIVQLPLFCFVQGDSIPGHP